MDRDLIPQRYGSFRGNILMVDDMPANLKVLTKLLTRAGHRVRPALDGRMALDAALSLLPDLVLLDVNMPGMSGYEVCKAFKEERRLSEVPIIFVSAAGETLDKVRAFQVGAVDYVTKPFDAEELLARVQTHLALSYGRKEQNAFGRMVAHDISNPLTQIILQIEVGLMVGELAVTEMSNIRDSAQRIQAIVSSMLTLSKLHQERVESAVLDMGALVERACQTLHRMVADSRASITILGTLPRARGYGPWIEQVWINYITNAVKYGGQPPQVVIGGERVADGMVRYTVTDNGRGLTPNEQAVVFNEFTRLNHIEIDGHGLGLAIVERVVTRMQGVVGLESNPGAGSTFYFSLPAV